MFYIYSVSLSTEEGFRIELVVIRGVLTGRSEGKQIYEWLNAVVDDAVRDRRDIRVCSIVWLSVDLS